MTSLGSISRFMRRWSTPFRTATPKTLRSMCDSPAVFRRERSTSKSSTKGPGFDPKYLPDPTAPSRLECPGGRGVMLMRAFMNHVEFRDRGNHVVPRKRAKRVSDLRLLVDAERPTKAFPRRAWEQEPWGMFVLLLRPKLRSPARGNDDAATSLNSSPSSMSRRLPAIRSE